MSKPPVLTGDPRTDRALLTLTRLLYEIAGNDRPSNGPAPDEVSTRNSGSPEPRPPPRHQVTK